MAIRGEIHFPRRAGTRTLHVNPSIAATVTAARPDHSITMKLYKLTAWPDLPSHYHRTAYRRMLCDMSHRYVSMQHLVSVSGIAASDVRSFVEMLVEKDLLDERASADPETIFDSLWDSLKPLGGWIYRTFTTDIGGRRQ